jgi:hypothetical protein
MEENGITKNLLELKSKVTELGHYHLQSRIPIELSRFAEEMEPFIILEKAFDEAISKFEYNLAKV